MIQLYKYEEIDGKTIKTVVATNKDPLQKSVLVLACLTDAENNYPKSSLVMRDYGFSLYDEDYDITVYYLIREVK